MTLVPIADLVTFPGNARRGDVESIKASLRRFGQYRTITVDRSTGHILVGNHTTIAAKELGWTQIEVHYVDYNEQDARAINVGDNRHGDRGHYDISDLVTQLQEVDDLTGTGYVDEDIARLLEQLAAADDVEAPADEPSAPADTTVTLKFTEDQAATWARFTLWLKDIYTDKDTLTDRLCEYLDATEDER